MIPSLNRDCVLDEALPCRGWRCRETALTQHCVTFSRPWISSTRTPERIDHYHFKM